MIPSPQLYKKGREVVKKIFAMFMVCTILLGLVGCNSSNPKLQDPSFVPLTMTPGETHTSYEDVEIQIDSLNWHEGNLKSSLVVAWNNETKYEVTYGASFEIERLDGAEWVSCAIPDDLVFTAIGYLLPAGKMKNETYTLTDMFDVTSPGTYRFKTDCYVSDNAEQGTKCELTAEFTLGNVKCPDDSKVTGTDVQWAAQYIRTNGYSEGVLYPSVRIIDSLQELKDYYNTWHEVFDLERKEKVYSDTTVGFLDACDQYDDAFFEKNYLIFVLLEEGSGSIRHEVRSVEQAEDKKISISIDRKVPEVGTDDMADWHIILELSRDVLVENSIDTCLYVDGLPSYMDDKIVIPQTEGAFKKPPEGIVITPEGQTAIHAAGYSWFCMLGNGLEEAVIADQAGRPLSKESLDPVIISSQHAETVYAPVPVSDAYEPTNSLGYLVKLTWETEPSSITYSCWPETVWQKENVPEETVVSQDGAFYAKPGGYVYEIVATWDDTGKGYHGRANYYVYIVGGDDHKHQVAATAQTIDDPVTGYCGNTWTRLHIDGKEYSFMYGYSVTLTDILVNLDYDPMRVCRCRPEYTVDTEFGLGYGINLTAGYARCEKGQADLTQEQIDTIAEIIEWAETTNCKYPIGN